MRVRKAESTGTAGRSDQQPADRAGERRVRGGVAVRRGRVWLPHELVAFPDEPAVLGPAAVECPTCGAHWRDDNLSFWEMVRANAAFPDRCLACGGTLPEWRVADVPGEPTGTDRCEDARPAVVPPA